MWKAGTLLLSKSSGYLQYQNSAYDIAFDSVDERLEFSSTITNSCFLRFYDVVVGTFSDEYPLPSKKLDM